MSEKIIHISSMTLDEKRRMADTIFNEAYESYHKYGLPYSPARLEMDCQHDFKACSLVAYRIMASVFGSPGQDVDWLMSWPLHMGIYPGGPGQGPEWLPIQYADTIGYNRLFKINRCAFPSPDSIIGFGPVFHPDYECPFTILKGLRHIGRSHGWTLFKLDPASSDDMTAMILLPLEKNFEIEFAHFPHDDGKRILFRWEDS